MEISQKPEKILKIKDLADKYGYSKSKLKMDYREKYGISLGKSVRNHRLKTAHQLIMEGTSVSKVSYIMGYSHYSSFSAAFTQHFGYSPKNVFLDGNPPEN